MFDTASDIIELVDNKVSESETLEFKRGKYGNSDEDKREFLRDVSAFANRGGGNIIIGMDEKDGVAHEITSLPIADIDNEVSRLESLLRTSLEPRVTGALARPVEIEPAGSVIVVHVPQSWNKPHRVSHKNSNRYFIRNSNGKHEMSVDELRYSFLSGETRIERIRNFVEKRVERATSARFREKQVGLGTAIMHLVPLHNFGHATNLDFQYIRQHAGFFFPITDVSASSRINADGFATTLYHGEKTKAECQLFRDGTVESVVSEIVVDSSSRSETPQGEKIFVGNWFVHRLVTSVQRYAEGVNSLGISEPYLFFLTLTNVNQAIGLFKETFQGRLNGFTADREQITLPEVEISSFADVQTVATALRPTLDALWNSFGYEECSYFKPDGSWNPERE